MCLDVIIPILTTITVFIITSLSLATLQSSTGSRSLSVRLIIFGLFNIIIIIIIIDYYQDCHPHLFVIMIPRKSLDTELSWPRRSSSSRLSTVTPRFTEPSHSSLKGTNL